ncbi:MAG: sulfatase-like hydrolase/transferase [Acidobacteriota bacterium]
MSRARHWGAPIKQCAALALLLGVAGCAAPTASEVLSEASQTTSAAGTVEPARDVVLVTLDTLRWDAVGFLGERRDITPGLDRWAARGTVFERAWAHNVMTLPSHANILTGRLPYQHGVRDNAGFALREGETTLATLLQDAGFATGAVVSAFPLDARYGLNRGFDSYDDRVPEGAERDFLLPERPGTESVELAEEWWAAHEGERRFLWLHLFDPHAPYRAPSPWRERFASEPYLGEVAALDAFLTPFLEGLDPQTTVVALTSDHGESLGEHGEQTHGLFAYDATLRVPLVIWGDGIPAGRSRAVAGHIDILPTLAAAAGVEAPGGLPGRSLLDAPEGPRSLYFEALGAHLDRDWAPLRGLLDGQIKAIDLPLPELYDLIEDPSEIENLVARRGDDHAQRVRELPSESEWPPDRAALSESEQRKLAALGYLGGSGTGPTRSPRDYGPADDPKNLVAIDELMHRFMATYRSGDLGTAERLARELVLKQPKMADGHYHLAQVLLDQNRVEEAFRTMMTAYRNGVRQPKLVRQLGLTLAEIGRAPDAVRLLSSLRESDDPKDLNALGLVLSEAGDQNAAREVLERVFTLDERNATAHETLALIAVRGADWAKALAESDRALAVDDSLALAWNYRGMALYNLNRKPEALDCWERSFQNAPDFDVLFNLGVVAAEIRDPRARRALELFVQEAPPARYGPDIAAARTRLRGLP